MPKGDKNPNRKRNNETKLIGRKAIKLSKKRSKIEKLQKFPKGTSQKKNLKNWNFVWIIEQRHMELRHGEEI
jgi:hypothetical protein